jgi:hypothetical protein
MVNTRNQHPSTNNENNAANSPAPLTLEQVLLMQAQMLQTMQQMMAMHQGQGHQHAPQPHLRDKLDEFQRTKPPTFSHSVEPMDADD